MTPPSQTTIFNHLALTRSDVEPVSIYNASQSFKTKLANASASILLDTINKLSSFKNYEPNSYQSGARALKLSVLDLLCYLNLGEEIAKTLFKNATNMTEKLGSLNILIKHDQVTNELDSFYETWNENNNVIDKWFSAQAVFTPPIKSLSVLSSLTKHPAFSITSPNRFRSLIGSFASGNMCGFHERSGKGYNIVTEWLMK